MKAARATQRRNPAVHLFKVGSPDEDIEQRISLAPAAPPCSTSRRHKRGRPLSRRYPDYPTLAPPVPLASCGQISMRLEGAQGRTTGIEFAQRGARGGLKRRHD